MGEGTIYPLMRRMQNDGLVSTYLQESGQRPAAQILQAHQNRRAGAEGANRRLAGLRGSGAQNPGRRHMNRAISWRSFATACRACTTPISTISVADYESPFRRRRRRRPQRGRSRRRPGRSGAAGARIARRGRFRRWESDRSAGNLVGVVLALLGLATIDLIFLLPFLHGSGRLHPGFGAATAGVFIAGIVISMMSLFPGWPCLAWREIFTGALAMGLLGVGLIAGSVGLGALFWLVLDFLARAAGPLCPPAFSADRRRQRLRRIS